MDGSGIGQPEAMPRPRPDLDAVRRTMAGRDDERPEEDPRDRLGERVREVAERVEPPAGDPPQED